jgi:hypothetical protein
MPENIPQPVISPVKLVEIQDYLDATSDATRRTRSVTITMVVTSVLILGALINSFQHQWMLERVHTFYNPKSEYVKSKILPPEMRAGFQSYDAGYMEKYRMFYEALTRSYVENGLSVKVPLFGFSIDVNDLGLLGGIAFVVLLVMYRFSLSRELENLKIAMDKAGKFGQLCEFYEVLAMRQVFTIPPSRTLRKPSRVLIWTPKLICFLPLLVHVAVSTHDFSTFWVGRAIAAKHNWINQGLETFLFVFILTFTIMALIRLRRIDAVWKDWWDQIQRLEATQEKG